MAWQNYKPWAQTSLEDSLIRWTKHNHPKELQRWQGYDRLRRKMATKRMGSQKWEADHIVPIAAGGEPFSHNIVMVLRSFNRRKGARRLPRAVEEWFLDCG